jgi:hypothetical protein
MRRLEIKTLLDYPQPIDSLLLTNQPYLRKPGPRAPRARQYQYHPLHHTLDQATRV